MSFSFLILFARSYVGVEASFKYFLVQSTASVLLLSSYELRKEVSLPFTFLLLLALVLKLGAAPLHSWFPHLSTLLPWGLNLVLMTLQRISPLFLTLFSPHRFFLLLSLLGALVGRVCLPLVILTPPLLAYSSVAHMGWIFGAGLCATKLSLVYLFFYLFLVSSVILFVASNSVSSIGISLGLLRSTRLVSLVLLASLGGIPPFLGFLPKLLVLFLLSGRALWLWFGLAMRRVLRFYFYLRMIFSPLLESSKDMNKEENFRGKVERWSSVIALNVTFSLLFNSW